MSTIELDVHVRTEPDDCPDLSWLGEFRDDWRPGCIDRKPYWSQDAGRYECRYWSPGHPYTHHRDWYKRHGYSKHEAHTRARACVLQDHRRHEDYCRGDWWVVGLIVSVSLDGHKLGQASIWGVESDCGEEYRDELVADLTADATAEARKALADILAAVGALP